MKITIETERDLCGDNFLKDGEMTVEKVNGYKSIVQLKDGSNIIYVDVNKLKKALEFFQ